MIDREPGLRDALRDTSRMFARARTRPWLTLCIALVVAGLVVVKKARQPRLYSSRIILRVAEADLEAGTSPRTAKHLRAHILDAVFTNTHLLALMKELNLYASQRQLDDQLALDSMRDDIEVEVWRNYFLEDRYEYDPGRSARVAIQYQNGDPALAHETVRALARLVTDSEAQARAFEAERALASAKEVLAAAEHESIVRRGLLAQKKLERRYAHGQAAMQLDIEVRALESSFEMLEKRITDAGQRATDLEVRFGMEKGGLGLRFEVADPGRVASHGSSTLVVLGTLGFLTFLFMLPLSALAVGAFDSRLRDPEDLARHEIELLGVVPTFDGDDIGAFAERLAKRGRLRV